MCKVSTYMGLSVDADRERRGKNEEETSSFSISRATLGPLAMARKEGFDLVRSLSLALTQTKMVGLAGRAQLHGRAKVFLTTAPLDLLNYVCMHV